MYFQKVINKKFCRRHEGHCHGSATLRWQENVSNTAKHKLHTGIPFFGVRTYRFITNLPGPLLFSSHRPEPKNQVKDQRIQIAPLKIKLEVSRYCTCVSPRLGRECPSATRICVWTRSTPRHQEIAVVVVQIVQRGRNELKRTIIG
jgi:hypothetical protein